MILTFKFRDNTYSFDDEKMGLGEARWVKQETGLLPKEFFPAVQELDPDAIACVIVLAMRRAGATDATIESICEDENGLFDFLASSQVAAGKGPAAKAPAKAATRTGRVNAVKG
jgi:hypothetical protein